MIFVRNPPKPPDYVFGLATPADMLRKLGWEIRQFRDRLATASEDLWGRSDLYYIAFNVAVTAFHCGDWAWRSLGAKAQMQVAEEYAFTRSGNLKTDTVRFMDAMCKRRSIDLCRSIANGSKHMGTSGKPNKPFSVSTIWEFRSDEDDGRTVTYLAVQDGDAVLRVEAVFDDAFRYWESMYRNFGFVEDRFIDADET